MQDRFKFRVWDKEINEMEDDLYDSPGDLEVSCINKVFEDYLSYDRYIVEQCTGLKDKNGKLIYENDFIQAENGDIYLIKWCQEKLGFVARTNNPDDVLESLDISSCEWEVVGNIHENADLLEKEDE